MASSISVRFFRIAPVHKTVPDFERALQAAFDANASPAGREREIDPGIVIRLERFRPDGLFYDGEAVRRQKGNFPPEANDAGLNPLPLPEGSGLGHCIAFRYDPSLSILAMQHDNRAVSVGRLLVYLRTIVPGADFRATPLVRQDAWDRYNRGDAKKFLLEIAPPSALEAVEGEVDTVVASSKRLGEFYGGPVIRIEVSMGRRKGSLIREKIEDTIRYFTAGSGRDADIRKLSVDIKPEEEKIDSIDFIDELLQVKNSLDLSEKNPDNHYEIRRAFISTCFSRHLDYIRRVYGDPS